MLRVLVWTLGMAFADIICFAVLLVIYYFCPDKDGFVYMLTHPTRPQESLKSLDSLLS